MIKFITSLIRFIFILILFLLFYIKGYYLINEKIQDNYYPDMFGYSYVKVDVDNNELDIKQDDYLFTKNIQRVSIDDIIVYVEKTKVYYCKVSEIDTENYICNDGLNNENKKVPIELYKGKVVYTNDTVSKVIKMLMNPIVIALMILYCMFIGQITYKRFN